MARIALSRPAPHMCPTLRGPPHQTQLADPDATYLERAHNCDNLIFRRRAALDELGIDSWTSIATSADPTS